MALLEFDGATSSKTSCAAETATTEKVTAKIDMEVPCFSRGRSHGQAFEDPLPLLAAVEKHGLEGIVSKRIDASYRSGSRSG